MPDGSVWNKWGDPSESKPPIRHEMPNGRRPLLWVYFCFSCAIYLLNIRRNIFVQFCYPWTMTIVIYLVMYSRVTWSSTLRRWLWHSTWARLIRIRASAVKPANAITTWWSSTHILRTVRSSCSLATDFFSTPKTTQFPPRTPTWKFKEK